MLGVLRDQMHSAGGPELVGAIISARLPDGRVLPNVGGGIGNVAYGQRFAGVSGPTAVATVRADAQAAGLKVKAANALMPQQAAPALVATTNDPAGFVAKANDIVPEIFGATGSFEGYYLEIQDSAGQPVAIQAASFRDGLGQWWIRPDLNPRGAPDGSHG